MPRITKNFKVTFVDISYSYFLLLHIFSSVFHIYSVVSIECYNWFVSDAFQCKIPIWPTCWMIEHKEFFFLIRYHFFSQKIGSNCFSVFFSVFAITALVHLIENSKWCDIVWKIYKENVTFRLFWNYVFIVFNAWNQSGCRTWF